jgi:adenosylcobinamide-phosphate synthase
MRLEYQILIAFALDLLLGDPRWLPHPVKLIGRFALALESPLRRAIPNARAAGVIAVLVVLSVTGLTTLGVVRVAADLHPFVGDAVSILLHYTTIAARDLARHSHDVYRALQDGDLPEARRRVSMIVGRDTDRLDEVGVTRATVESVAENIVDGVTAPILFAVLGGPVGAMLYKAVSTLDSTFGYKNDRYLQFGWASARLDDIANYVPARLTAPLVAVAAALLGLRPLNALRMWLRDGHKHESPNAGLAEAAVAGALGVQLGGLNHYDGEPSKHPPMGDSIQPLERRHILKTNWLMVTTSALALAIFLGARAAVCAGGAMVSESNQGTPIQLNRTLSKVCDSTRSARAFSRRTVPPQELSLRDQFNRTLAQVCNSVAGAGRLLRPIVMAFKESA